MTRIAFFCLSVLYVLCIVLSVHESVSVSLWGRHLLQKLQGLQGPAQPERQDFCLESIINFKMATTQCEASFKPLLSVDSYAATDVCMFLKGALTIAPHLWMWGNGDMRTFTFLQDPWLLERNNLDPYPSSLNQKPVFIAVSVKHIFGETIHTEKCCINKSKNKTGNKISTSTQQYSYHQQAGIGTTSRIRHSLLRFLPPSFRDHKHCDRYWLVWGHQHEFTQGEVMPNQHD